MPPKHFFRNSMHYWYVPIYILQNSMIFAFDQNDNFSFLLPVLFAAKMSVILSFWFLHPKFIQLLLINYFLLFGKNFQCNAVLFIYSPFKPKPSRIVFWVQREILKQFLGQLIVSNRDMYFVKHHVSFATAKINHSSL